MPELNSESTEAATPADTPTPETHATKPAAGTPKRPVAAKAPKATKGATPAKKAPKTAAKAKPAKASKTKAAGPREGSKTAKILALLRRADGATLKELMKATGWAPHSLRGFLSAAVGKKMGLKLVSQKPKDGERSYAIKG